MELLLRLIVAIVVAAVIVWLGIDVAGIVSGIGRVVVALIAGAGFLVVFLSWDGRVSRV